ncbi:MAG: DUF4274 domain-containing protein [Comamonas sp.]|uniref:DUF4274 domain-containing protein n=1 Tax=unclassified Comamonas TaxID=2638500 RepID=UPI000EB11E1B|nr:DUF4274 domain-containing protein [Comamonas sp. lk]
MEDDDFDGLYLDLMQEFLSEATPVQWLAVACTMNYDGNGNGALVDWMIKQRQLEPAVAKALYWYLQPSYYQHYAVQEKVPSINRKGWARVQALAERFESGKLPEPTIGWDPANDLASPTCKSEHPGYDWTAEEVKGKDAAWSIPAIMRTAVPGPQPDIYAYCDEHDWEEGMPPHVQEALNAAMNEEPDTDDED